MSDLSTPICCFPKTVNLFHISWKVVKGETTRRKRSEMFYKKGVLKDFVTLLKKDLVQVFSSEFCEIF